MLKRNIFFYNNKCIKIGLPDNDNKGKTAKGTMHWHAYLSDNDVLFTKYIYISHPIYRDGERARLAPVKKKKKKFLPWIILNVKFKFWPF